MEAWRAHPVTEIVLGYVEDFSEYIRGSWRDGNNWTEESRITVQNYEDLAALDLESIQTFYERDDEQKSD